MGIPPHFGEHFASLLSSLFEVGLLPYQRSLGVVCNFCSFLIQWTGGRKGILEGGWGMLLKRRKGENRIRKLNVLYLEKKKWDGTFIPVGLLFSFCWIFL